MATVAAGETGRGSGLSAGEGEGKAADPRFRTGRAAAPAIVVLVVEDDTAVREPLAEFLVASGFGVAQAASVADAERALEAASVDVVVTDLGLPDGDGRAVARAARRRAAGLPVILLTGWTPGPAEAGRFGVDALIAKPVRPNDLIDEIVRLAPRTRGR